MHACVNVNRYRYMRVNGMYVLKLWREQNFPPDIWTFGNGKSAGCVLYVRALKINENASFLL